MPINGLSVGRDVTLDIIDPANGGLLAWAEITGFESRQMTKMLQSTSLDGSNNYAEIPQGWEVSFTLDRANNNVDAYFASVEDGYFTGVDYAGVQVTETITNPDGSVNQYRYEKLSLKLADAGAKTGDNHIKMKVDGKASRRRQIS